MSDWDSTDEMIKQLEEMLGESSIDWLEPVWDGDLTKYETQLDEVQARMDETEINKIRNEDELYQAIETGEIEDNVVMDPEPEADLGFEQEMTNPSWFKRNILRNKPKPTGQQPEFEIGDAEETGEADLGDIVDWDAPAAKPVDPNMSYQQEYAERGLWDKIRGKKPEPIGGEEFEIGDEAEADDYMEYIAENENITKPTLAEDLGLDYVEQQELLQDEPLLDTDSMLQLDNFVSSNKAPERPLENLDNTQLEMLEEKASEPPEVDVDRFFQEELGVDDAYEYCDGGYRDGRIGRGCRPGRGRRSSKCERRYGRSCGRNGGVRGTWKRGTAVCIRRLP